jgi:hypothetical protein
MNSRAKSKIWDRSGQIQPLSQIRNIQRTFSSVQRVLTQPKPISGSKVIDFLKLTELLESVLDRTAIGVNIEIKAQVVLKVRNF